MRHARVVFGNPPCFLSHLRDVVYTAQGSSTHPARNLAVAAGPGRLGWWCTGAGGRARWPSLSYRDATATVGDGRGSTEQRARPALCHKEGAGQPMLLLLPAGTVADAYRR